MRLKKLNKKFIIILTLVILVTLYFVFYVQKNKYIAEVLSAASAYKDINNNYGVNLKGEDSCFINTSFLNDIKIKNIFEEREVENVVCRIKTDASKLIADWSVTLVIKERAYCGDSAGNNVATPGITLTTSCKGE